MSIHNSANILILKWHFQRNPFFSERKFTPKQKIAQHCIKQCKRNFHQDIWQKITKITLKFQNKIGKPKGIHKISLTQDSKLSLKQCPNPYQTHPYI